MKRSLEKRHTQTHRNLFKIFQWSQKSFSIRRKWMYLNTRHGCRRLDNNGNCTINLRKTSFSLATEIKLMKVKIERLRSFQPAVIYFKLPFQLYHIYYSRIISLLYFLFFIAFWNFITSISLQVSSWVHHSLDFPRFCFLGIGTGNEANSQKCQQFCSIMSILKMNLKIGTFWTYKSLCFFFYPSLSILIVGIKNHKMATWSFWIQYQVFTTN